MPGTADLNHIAPLAALSVGALVVIAADLVAPRRMARPWVYVTAIAALVLTGWYWTGLWSAVQEGPLTSFFGAFVSDKLSLALAGMLLVAALLVVLMSLAHRERDMSGYLSLVLFAAAGMMVLGGAGDLMVLFVALELFSLSLYALIAFQREREEAKEGAFKYLILGSVAAGFLLYGFGLIYGAVGSLALDQIAAYAAAGHLSPLYHAGFALALVGFAFKLALVPFHTWAPDAYQAAPAPVAGLMAAGTKAAALVALARFLWAVVPAGEWTAKYLLPLAVLSGLSMIVGSLATLFQTNVKRLLAYSSITHAGYLVMPLVALQPAGLRVSLYYLFGYMLMSLGAFAVIAALQRQGEPGDELETYEGLYARKPWLAMLLAFFFLALAGMPPTVGMTGKLLLVGGGLQAGAGWLVAALVVSTAISAYAYLRVVLAAFRTAGAAVVAAAGSSVGVASGEAAAGAEEESGEWSFAWADIGLGVVFALTVAGVLALGLLPETFLTALEGLLPPR
ncbi:MAG: NADH-quinone oxidoreductase subunit N [Limnochordales bacterium]